MPTKHYSKELPEAPVYINGMPIKFDFLETSDPRLIHELDVCIARGVGGIVPITQEQYTEEVKKKASASLSKSSSNQPHGRQELSALHAQRVAAAAGRGESFLNGTDGVFAEQQRGSRTTPVSGRPMPDPIQVPSPNEFSGIFTKTPPTAKASAISAAAKA